MSVSFHKILLTLFFFGIFLFSVAQTAPSYQELIIKADAYLEKKDYYNAKTSYQLAVQRDPNAEYPKKKIAEIIQKLNEEMDVRILYEEKMQQAANAYTNNELVMAIGLYKEAATYVSSEGKPKQEILRIEKELAELKSKQDKFAALVLEGKTARQKQDFQTALLKYEEAKLIFPAKSEVLTEIAQLKLLLNQQSANETKFKQWIADGDKQMEQNRFQAALKSYQAALALQIDDPNAKNRMAVANQSIKKEELFNAAVEKGDAFYIALELESAQQFYESAKKIWPEKTYPSNMLTKIEEAKKRRAFDLTLLDEEYKKRIVAADNQFVNKKYELAYDLYIRALNLKPEEEYPQKQIQQIDKLLSTGSIQVNCEVNENGLALAEAFVELIQDGKTEEFALSSNGKYKLKLKLNANYLIRFKKQGYIHKVFSIDSHLPDAQDLNTLFVSDLSVELFPTCSIDLTFFDAPLANISYQASSGEFTYDVAGVQAKISRAERLRNECATVLLAEKKQKEYDNLLAQVKEAKTVEDYGLAVSLLQKASSLFPEKTFPKDELKAINLIQTATKEYLQFLSNGDAKYAQGKLNDALFDYYKAQNLNPKATYPQEKIGEIDAILALKQNEEKAHQKQIHLADSLFSAKDWTKAMANYEKAILLKSSDAYAQNKIIEIKRLAEEENKLNAAYLLVLKKGDQLFESQSFSEARKAYLEASRLKPSEQYPIYKIEDINTIEEQKDINSTNSRYAELIASADQLFKENALNQALTLYQQAANLKPKELYPPDQIAKINQILAEKSSLDKRYQRYLKSADSSFYIESYGYSRQNYLLANETKPAETYPLSQIKKIDALLASLLDKEQNYKTALTRADIAFSDKKFSAAKADYVLALSFKAEEAYPKKRIAEIETILAQLGALEMAYQKAIQEGDKAFGSQNYNLALNSYREALKIKENEAYPKNKIAEIETLLAKSEKNENDYQLAIAQADVFYEKKNYSDALPLYKKAQGIKPKEKYPPDQISRINSFLNGQQSADDAYANALLIADKLFNEKRFQEALSSYQKANQLKPSEKYPPLQIAKIRELLGNSQLEYQAFVKQGDDAFRISVFQDAIVAYENALGIFPTEAYPRMMLDKIDAKIRRESVVSLVSVPEILPAGQEKKFAFKPIDYRDRQNNYLLIEMKNQSAARIRVFVSFGKGELKNGGYSISLMQRDGYTKYFVRIDKNMRWLDEENNWISLLPEGGDLDVKMIHISRDQQSGN